jgi:acetate kinase
MRILVVNAGSRTLKLTVLDEHNAVVGSSTIEPWAAGKDNQPITKFIEQHAPVDAAGHRIVHGGPRFAGPVVLSRQVIDELAALTELAPLHQPPALAAVDAVGAALPGAPMVGCFDTAFHRSLPAAAATYALPMAWQERFGLRRYGFHGLSHAYASRRAAELVGRPPADLRIVTCHLGAGASLCAVASGVSVDTTMGFTPLEGVVMATRSGSIDPGLLVWLIQRGGINVDELSDRLEHSSGLAGLTSTSGDMREVVAAMNAGQPAATLAWDVYVHRLRSGIAAMAAAMDGLDVLAFTGGVAEHQPTLRQAAATGLAFVGVALDAEANGRTFGDGDIGNQSAKTRTVVVTAREDLEIADQVRECLRGQANHNDPDRARQ